MCVYEFSLLDGKFLVPHFVPPFVTHFQNMCLIWLKLSHISLILQFYTLIFINSWFLATVAWWLVPSDVIVFGSRDQLFRSQRIEFVSNAKFQRNSTLGTDISHPWQRLLGGWYLLTSSFLVIGTKIFEFSILELSCIPIFSSIQQFWIFNDFLGPPSKFRVTEHALTRCYRSEWCIW